MKSKTSLFLILIFTFIIPSIIHSAEVTRATAEQVAINLYAERNEMAPNDFKIVETIIEQENAENIFYIFNFDKTGFVIVSADDIAVPILGYVFKHNYTTENHPPQFEAMLASFRDQILFARENDLSPPQETVNKWNRLKVTTDMFVPENNRAVGPLLSTTWNQGLYYNESCPADGASTAGNGYVWAGCTATATAQVMKYHAHPATGEGTHSYTHTTYGPQSANFGATTYSWALMPNNVTVVNPFVHTLLYHVGVGAEMNYGAAGSGAWIGGAVPASALSALQNHFKYDLNSNYDQRNNYTLSVWNSMLKTELDNNRPLVYDGYNIGYADGHAFVIDGYTGSTNDSYHVNFGWSGSYDGYYTLDALAPVLPTHDYRYFQAALFGVEPRKWRPLPDETIIVSQLPYTGVDLDDYCEVTATSYSVVTDLTGQEFALAINGSNELVFTASPTITSNVNIDITIRATYTSGTVDDTFNFIITGASTVYDWGDAPCPTYPTLATSSGAYHEIVQGIKLGTLIDSELDGQPDATATGDDNDGLNDDDGVVFTSNLIPGSNATVTVTASVPGILDAWLDFDIDGLWIQANDQIFMNQVLSAGSNVLTFPVPASAALGTTFARFRFNTVGVLGMTGGASNGEVEDYQVTIGEESSIKWEQLPDLSVNGMDVTCSNNDMFAPPVVLADDFECTTTGPITDIHVWGSWWQDIQPEDMSSVIFHLGIYSDIPDPDEEGPLYSMPGSELWLRDFYFGEYDGELYNVGDEGWFDPLEMIYVPIGDTECWLYNFYIDEAEAFIQEGSPDEPVVYWLQVQAEFLDPLAMFGWKTSETHWNDDAVWGNGIAPFMGPWNELRYPQGHPYSPDSIDLAFRITTTIEEPEEYDFGDAPEGNGALAYPSLGVNGMFPTCIAVGPVGNYVQHGFGENWAWFGPMVDIEADGNAGLCPGCFPTYDDDECFNDGDAGLLFPDSYTIDATGAVIPCPGATGTSPSLGIICNNAIWGNDIEINVTNNMPVDGYVNVLCDWNQNGQWQNDALTHCAGVMTPEHVLVDFVIPAGQSGLLSTIMAAGSSFQIGPNSGYAWVRFSITESPVGNDWDGSGVFEDGETEDYLLYIEDEEIEELDFGDAPDPNYPTLLVNDGARHILDGVTFLGASVDAEPDGQQTANADGDDLDGNDDEDGVLFVSPLIQGEQGAVYILANVSGLLNAWLDFDGNGSWEASEQIFTDESLISGWNTKNFPVPVATVRGNTFARFRFDTGGGLGITGQADNGEVEDYQVTIEEDPHDGIKMHYHQWPDTTSFGVDVCVIEEIDLPRRIVADDFLCVESGPVNSIHIWGSWKYDEFMLDNLIFDLAIWSDNPMGENGWSEPETLLWQKQFVPGDYNENLYYDTSEGECWYDPCTGTFLSPGDYGIWKYDFLIPDADAFFQEASTIYWLSVKAYVSTPGYQFGWKSSVNHWNDDAVYQCNFPVDPWTEMIYPSGHPFNPINEAHVSMDMAFYIDCHPANPVNFTITKVGTNMNLQWNPSWCASYYNVYSSTDPYATFPGGWTLEPTGTHITTTTWNDPLSTAGSKKFYRVTAEN